MRVLVRALFARLREGMDFGAKAGSYVDCFMEAIRWQNAERHFKALSESSAK